MNFPRTCRHRNAALGCRKLGARFYFAAEHFPLTPSPMLFVGLRQVLRKIWGIFET